MRILHIMQAAQIGGAERSLLVLLPALRAAGHDVAFLGFAKRLPSGFVDALREREIDARVVTGHRLFGPSVALRIRREIANYGPDVVHTHLLYGDVQGQLASASLRIPAVRTIHGPGNVSSHWKDRIGSRVAGLLARRTITLSPHAAKFARSGRHAPASRIVIVPHGIEPVADARIARCGSIEPTVICTSRLIEGKGHAVLIRAMKKVLETHRAHLHIVGTGPLRNDLQQFAADQLPEASFTFSGFSHDVGAALAASDIFVLPTGRSLGEGSPVAVLEAMAAGLPIVASDLPALRDLFGSTEAGVLVEPGDPDALAAAIVNLLDAPNRRAALGLRGRQLTHERYSVEQLVEQTVGVYKSVLNR